MNDESSKTYISQAPIPEVSTGDTASNSSQARDAIAGDIEKDLREVLGSASKSLELYFRIGDKLIELRRILGNGDTFGEYVQTKLGLKRAWRYRVMRLAACKEDVCKAIAWAQKEQQIVVSFGVDRAVRIYNEWKRHLDGGNIVTRKSRRRSTPSLSQQNAELKQQIAMIEERRLQVEAELSQMNSRFSEPEKDVEGERAKLTTPPEPTADTDVAE